MAVANPRRIYTEEEQQFLLNTYCVEKKSLIYCSKMIHSNPNTIKKFLVENGITIRDHATAMALATQQIDNRKYPVKDDYFSIPNSKMAYLLGFIAADGYIPKTGHNLNINLAIIDKSFLEKIQQEIGGRPIKEYIASNGHQFCAWSCASRQIQEDLAKYNIVNNKTFTHTFPKNLPDIYWKDYIRGYFDGDGSIYEDMNGMRWSIGSANEDVLKTINQYFNENCNLKIHTIYQNKREKAIEYVLRYRTQEAITIYNHLYYSGCELFLPRKYEKFTELINKKKTSTRLHIPN